jgi:acyl-coenzyme A synthetase/AMP-(fatty) acid ligase
MSSGDHLPVSAIDQLMAAFPGIELHVVYGMAELAGRFCALPPEHQSDKRGSVGFPIAGLEYTVRDDAGVLCPAGEIGNIHVQGLLGFGGYFGNPAASAEVLGAHGFANGDKGYVDADGFLFLAGRSDSVFKRSGLKVSAQLVTDALVALDYVADAYTRAEEDMIEGNVPVSYVVWSGDKRGMPEVLADLRKVLPVNHLPRRIQSLPAIPRTGSGKVDRAALASVLAALVPAP